MGNRTGAEPDDVRGRPSSAYRGHIADADELAVTLGGLARALQDQDGVRGTLDAIVAAAVETVPGAQYAGLSVVERRREVATWAATDEVVRQVDQVQYDIGQGPCLDAVYEQRTVRLPDLTVGQGWPRFADRVARLGVRSMLSFQLYVQQGNLGALNLYSRHRDAFDDESEHVGLLFAAHAAVAMSGAQHREQLLRAMAVHDLIGQAKGILIERYRLTGDQAFALLVRTSQHANIKLVKVARQLTETGELHSPNRRSRPGGATPPGTG